MPVASKSKASELVHGLRRGICLGRIYELKGGRVGVVKWIGEPHFATGEMIGLELIKGDGKNNGTIGKKTYFKTGKGRGAFVRPKQLTKDVTEREKSKAFVAKVDSGKTKPELPVEEVGKPTKKSSVKSFFSRLTNRKKDEKSGSADEGEKRASSKTSKLGKPRAAARSLSVGEEPKSKASKRKPARSFQGAKGAKAKSDEGQEKKLQATNAKLEREKERLKRRTEAQKKDNGELKRENETLIEENETLREENGELKEENGALKLKCEALRREVEILKQQASYRKGPERATRAVSVTLEKPTIRPVSKSLSSASDLQMEEENEALRAGITALCQAVQFNDKAKASYLARKWMERERLEGAQTG